MMNDRRLVKMPRSEREDYTLAGALQQITKVPSRKMPLLDKVQVRRLTNKKYLSDAELETILHYFEQRQKSLFTAIKSQPKFMSNGQKYYWVNENLIP